MNVFIPGPIATPQRAQSHPGEDRSKLRTAQAAARALLFVLGPDGSALNGNTVEM